MKILVLAGALLACQAAEEPRMVHIFRGSQDAVAYTTDRNGANLPARYRPWHYLQSTPRSDPRFAAGRDREAMLEVETKGYSVAFMRVTFQPVR